MSNPIDNIVNWFIDNPSVRSIGFHYLPSIDEFSLPDWAVASLYVNGHDDALIPTSVFGINAVMNLNKPLALSEVVDVNVFKDIALQLSSKFEGVPFVLNMQSVLDLRVSAKNNRITINCKSPKIRTLYMGVHL